jgi:RNA polymerase sigma factor (sigma-70 family)
VTSLGTSGFGSLTQDSGVSVTMSEKIPNSPKKMALERFFRQSRQELLEFAAAQIGRSLRSTVSEEDIFSETCLRAFASIDDFRAGVDDLVALKAWVYTILRRAIVHAARKNRKGLERLESDIVNAEPDDGPTLSKRIGTGETLERLGEAINKLPEEWQTVLDMLYFQGFTVSDIAEKLGKTRDVIHKLLRRARVRLHELMGNSSGHQLPGRKRKPKPPKHNDEPK